MEARHKFVRHGFPIRKQLFLFKKKTNQPPNNSPSPSLFSPSIHSQKLSLLSQILFPSKGESENQLLAHRREKDIDKNWIGFVPRLVPLPSKFSYLEKPVHLFPMDRSQSRPARCDGSHRGRGLLRVCRKFSITRRRRAGLLRARGRTLGAARNTVGNTWLRSTWVSLALLSSLSLSLDGVRPGASVETP